MNKSLLFNCKDCEFSNIILFKVVQNAKKCKSFSSNYIDNQLKIDYSSIFLKKKINFVLKLKKSPNFALTNCPMV